MGDIPLGLGAGLSLFAVTGLIVLAAGATVIRLLECTLEDLM